MRMSCEICQSMKSKLKLTSVWAHEGTPNIQCSSIIRHNSGTEHQNALMILDKEKLKELIIMQEQDDNELPLIATNQDKIVFNTVYYAAKSETPSENINGILALQKRNGLDCKYTNLCWITIAEMQNSIAFVLKREQVKDINESPVFAIILDESRDVTVEKRLSICIRYVKAGEHKTDMFCNVPVDDGCSHTIVNCVVHEFQEMGIDLTKCTSLATDGTAFMMGKHKGVGKQMQTKYSPYCIQTHCIAHRLKPGLNGFNKEK